MLVSLNFELIGEECKKCLAFKPCVVACNGPEKKTKKTCGNIDVCMMAINIHARINLRRARSRDYISRSGTISAVSSVFNSSDKTVLRCIEIIEKTPAPYAHDLIVRGALFDEMLSNFPGDDKTADRCIEIIENMPAIKQTPPGAADQEEAAE